MPLPIAHGLLGGFIVAAIHPRPKTNHFTPIFLGLLLGISADFDFALAWLFNTRSLHRGFSHSISFAFIVFLTLVLILGKHKLKEAVAYGASFGSHGLLDYVTTKQGGSIALFWPFSSERIKLGWFGLSEGAAKLPIAEIIHALAVELIIFAPLLIITLAFRKHLKTP